MEGLPLDFQTVNFEKVVAMMIIEMMLMCSFQLWVHLGHRKEAVQLHKGANLQGQVGCLLRKTRK